MTRLLTLEDFSLQPPAGALGDPQAEISDEARLATYEEGYKAGWDDAAKAEAQSQTRIAADLGQSLQDLSFTYHEARAHILQGIAPLLRLMAEKVLPKLARDHFAESILEVVQREVDTASRHPLELVINPINREGLAHLLGDEQVLPLTVVDEPTLGQGQAYLRGATGEHEIDIDLVLSEIETAVAAFLSESQKQRVA